MPNPLGKGTILTVFAQDINYLLYLLSVIPQEQQNQDDFVRIHNLLIKARKRIQIKEIGHAKHKGYRERPAQ